MYQDDSCSGIQSEHQSFSVLLGEHGVIGSAPDCVDYSIKTMRLINNAFHMLLPSPVVLLMIATKMSVDWGRVPAHSPFDYVRNVWFNPVPLFFGEVTYAFRCDCS